MRTIVVSLAAFLFLSGLTFAADAPPNTKVGRKIDNVTLHDTAGKPWSLHDVTDKQAVVVVFLSFECPVSNSYTQLLSDLAKTYGSRGVAVVGIASNPDDDTAKHVQEHRLPFPVLRDDKHSAADAFKAEVTPEVFLLDRHHILRYRGRIDNGYAARLKRNVHVTSHDLRNALDDLLAGKPVREPVTQAVGCAIVRGEAAKAGGPVTYYRDVAPILQTHCQTCHRPGEVGPFALMNYRQAVNWAGDIKEYTQSRKMPPWKPVEGVAFHNERRLSDKDLATLATWADHGTPEGNPKDAPPPRTFTDGWQLGQPDLVLTVPDEFQVGPSGSDIFRCFVLPTGLTEDKFVNAVEVRPGNPRVVHHSLLFIDTTGQGRKLEQKQQELGVKEDDKDRGPGYSVAMGVGFLPQGGLGGWAPGQMARYLPENTGYHLPKGSDVVMQLHYHRNGRTERDRTTIGLYFAKKPVGKRYQSVTIPGGGRGATGFLRLAIPAGAEKHLITGTIWVDHDCTLHSVMPHMHMIGRQIKVTVTPPDGPSQPLVGIEDWDYNWQETYVLKEPMRIKAGTRFDVEAVYDNSDKNPNNPFNPPRTIRFGEQTTNEMCFVFLGATADTPGRLRPRFEPLKK